MFCAQICPTFVLILAATFGAVGASPAGGQTVIFVDAAATGAGNGGSWDEAYTSVQPALNAATNGQQVWVAAGRYVGTITLADGVALYGGFAGTEDPATFDLGGRDFTAHETILDGNQGGSVVTAPAGATATTRIDGFTITNGNGTLLGSRRYGGGLYLSGSSPTIENNRVTGNSAVWGGGLYLVDSSPTVVSNRIVGNSSSFYGGGLYLSDSVPTIICNMIVDNTAASEGGGMYLYSSSPTISNNTISGNAATYGGGLSLSSSSPEIANNLITGNRTTGYAGGGIRLRNSSPVIANNTITRNAAGVSSGVGTGGGLDVSLSSCPMILGNGIAENTATRYGGGLFVSSSSPTIANNNILGNSAGGGGGVYMYSSSALVASNTIVANGGSDGAGVYLSGSPTIVNNIVAFNASGICQATTSSTPGLRYNCVYGNTGYNYTGLSDPSGSNGNISADPQLADLAFGNVHIQPDSPCVDAGSNGSAYGDLDVDGQTRIQPEGGAVDIGADESDDTVWPAGPYAIVRVSPDGDDEHDGSAWDLAKRTVQAGIDAASAAGGDVWVRAGTYYERITLRPFAYVYGGFKGGETERGNRDWLANLTILDGEQQGSVVTAQAGHRVNAIDGFTITNGSGTVLGSASYCYGGGLYLLFASPTIENNRVTGNEVHGEHSRGGGLFMNGSSSVIVKNAITGNGADGAEGYGGGVYLAGGYPMIASNAITSNSASSAGGGLYVSSASATIWHNTIGGNSVLAGKGGGLCLDSSLLNVASSTIIGNNRITGNNVGGDYAAGGGLYLYISASSCSTIANNMIVNNSASGSGACGGGVRFYCPYSTTIITTITGNTIAGNYASSGGGGLDLLGGAVAVADTIVAFNSSGVYRTGNISTTLRHNCVYGNSAYNYSGVADPTGTYGNISVDPLFAQRPDDLHLLAGSPCLDAGSNGLAVGDYDVDGWARIVDSDEDGVAVVDMGAHEFDPTVAQCDLDYDRVVDGLDYAAFRAAFGHAVGQAGYNARCDYDGSGTVGLKDYQAWLGCYRECVGNPLAGPPSLPLPVPVPTPAPTPVPGPQSVTDVGGDVCEGAGQSPVRVGTGRP